MLTGGAPFVVTCRQRRVYRTNRTALVICQPPVIRIKLTLNQFFDLLTRFEKGFERRPEHHLAESPLIERRQRIHFFGLEPTGPSMTSRVESDFREPPIYGAMTTIFQSLKISVHVRGFPRGISC